MSDVSLHSRKCKSFNDCNNVRSLFGKNILSLESVFEKLLNDDLLLLDDKSTFINSLVDLFFNHLERFLRLQKLFGGSCKSHVGCVNITFVLITPVQYTVCIDSMKYFANWKKLFLGKTFSESDNHFLCFQLLESPNLRSPSWKTRSYSKSFKWQISTFCLVYSLSITERISTRFSNWVSIDRDGSPRFSSSKKEFEIRVLSYKKQTFKFFKSQLLNQDIWSAIVY